ncbi:nose resistant to fluoxetine protein 6 [Caerostris extrusa]|uniref:Nose resistant to fluoxetine protein 6 n=1 Tax=Caerostris extrusa TaxID=172846 RepID=A0AAV4QC78_CAEEX|nr:nose resistant to fluoxetine protein 6 [Caerostris extrusa]
MFQQFKLMQRTCVGQNSVVDKLMGIEKRRKNSLSTEKPGKIFHQNVREGETDHKVMVLSPTKNRNTKRSSLVASFQGKHTSECNFPDYPPTDLHSEEKELDDGELKTFAEVENKIKSVIENIIKKALPFVIRSSGDIRLSGKCMAGIFKMVIGMQKLEEWALKE